MTIPKIRVKIAGLHNWYKPSKWVKDLIGKTGTIVWLDSGGHGEYQCDIEMDEPWMLIDHEMTFLTTCYVFPSLGRQLEFRLELIDDAIPEDVFSLARRMRNVGGWSRFREKNGDPRPWTEVEQIIERLEALEA